METFITIIHVIVSLFLIMVVLLQAGKGAGIGATFGGASQTVFGGRGAGNFLSRLTAVTAFVFVLTSITLAYESSRGSESGIGDVNAALPDGGTDKGWEELGVDPSATGTDGTATATATDTAATAAGTADLTGTADATGTDDSAGTADPADAASADPGADAADPGTTAPAPASGSADTAAP